MAFFGLFWPFLGVFGGIWGYMGVIAVFMIFIIFLIKNKISSIKIIFIKYFFIIYKYFYRMRKRELCLLRKNKQK